MTNDLVELDGQRMASRTATALAMARSAKGLALANTQRRVHGASSQGRALLARGVAIASFEAWP